MIAWSCGTRLLGSAKRGVCMMMMMMMMMMMPALMVMVIVVERAGRDGEGEFYASMISKA
jgi:hypothetical protein